MLLISSGIGLHAQPIPLPETTENARYIFTVYTSASSQEATIWRTASSELTTHRARLSDSTQIRFQPAQQAVLRTFVDQGGAAGAVQVNEERGSPVLQEILCYDQLLSSEQRQLTESYLAIKHGLTLNQTLPTNYLVPGPDGRAFPVWTATAERAFRHRIIGLAWDTAIGLERLKASSVLAPDLLKLSWETSPGSTAYLLLADDGAPTALAALEPELPGLIRLQRRWRVQAWGDVPETEVEIDTDKLFARLGANQDWIVTLIRTCANDQIPEDTATETLRLQPTLKENGKLSFILPTGTTHFQLAQTCHQCSVPRLVTDNYFTSAQLSPNPVQTGQAIQARVSLAEKSALILTAYDALGREVQRQNLPPNTHHLTELTFPVPGTYSLHLRPRLKKRSAPQHTLKIVVH